MVHGFGDIQSAYISLFYDIMMISLIKLLVLEMSGFFVKILASLFLIGFLWYGKDNIRNIRR